MVGRRVKKLDEPKLFAVSVSFFVALTDLEAVYSGFISLALVRPLQRCENQYPHTIWLFSSPL